MEVRRTKQGPAVILMLTGAMVDDQLDAFSAEIEKCLAGASVRVIVELSRVPFIDSVGLEGIVDAAARLARQGGNLCVTGLNDICHDIFTATRLRDLIQIYPEIDSALGNIL